MRFLRSLGAGLVIGIAGFLGACIVFVLFYELSIVFKTGGTADNFKDKMVYLVVAGIGIGSFLAGTASWWLIADGHRTPARGALTGALAGIAAHPFCWFFILLWDGSGLKDLLTLPLPAGAFSLVIVGWVTVPPPVLAGLLLGRLRPR